jgi:hypothetical protein
MRFANVRELKLETSRILMLNEEAGPIVLTKHGKPVALLKSITEDDLTLKLPDVLDRIGVKVRTAGFKHKCHYFLFLGRKSKTGHTKNQ